MAEAPPNGLFWASLDEATDGAERDGDHLVIDAVAHGPAGSSSVELPGGDVLEVDHLDPARFVGARVGGDEPASSTLLFALFGGDGALQILDAADVPGGSGGERDGRESSDEGREAELLRTLSSPQRSLDRDAQRAGRLVVLADLANDPAAEPLARIVAAAEFVAALDSTAGGDLFAPFVPELVGHAASSAAEVDSSDLLALRTKLRFRIMSTIDVLIAEAQGADLAQLADLVGRIRRPVDELQAASTSDAYDAPLYDEDVDSDMPSAMVSLSDDAGFAAASAPIDRSQLPSGSRIQVVRSSPSTLEVTVARDERGRWVRVLRSDGLVALGLAPLRRDGLVARAELLVPVDTHTGDLEVQVVDADEVARLGGSPLDLMRRAVRAGRAAASAERRGDRGEATDRWHRCGRLWDQLGDSTRARQARSRGTSAGGRIMVDPLLADELDPFRTDVRVERGATR